jgi:hypothetical protein
MNKRVIAAILLGALCAAAPPASARPDAIWARSTNGAPITLDGHLDEPAWANAESTFVYFGTDAGVPGSGWKYEAGRVPIDSAYAVLKFLTVGNKLYLGARVRDKSIGGSIDFNRFDGLLMAIKDHASPDAPKPVAEYFYSWWIPEYAGTIPPVDTIPNFRGRWAQIDQTIPRTQQMIDAWDAVTWVQGHTNTDPVAAPFDTAYTVEMKFDLTPMGYNITQAAGDIVEWNLSLYDCDWNWPLNGTTFSANRVWWESPWGNTAWYSEVRIYCKPSVTVASGPAPVIGPEMIIPSAGSIAAPVIDGQLTDPIWSQVPSFDIRYGDDFLRESYPGIQRYRAGQFQPTVNGGQAAIIDPGDATVRYFVKGDWLYLGFDVRDQVVQYVSQFDRWDGFLVTLNEKTLRGPDNNLMGRRLSFQVGPGGTALAADFLPFLRDTLNGAQLALALKPGTTVDTLGTQADQGYTAELAVDLTKLGYPAGLGDRIIHLGVTLLDGDSFTPFTDSYGTRTWWMRQYEGECCPVWAYADPTAVVAVGDPPPGARTRFAILGSFPNPATHFATVRYTVPEPVSVTLETFDLAGRLIRRLPLGVQPAGESAVNLARGAAPGIVFYRLRATDPSTGRELATLSGKALFVD